MSEEIRRVIHIDTTRSATSVKDLRDEIKSLRDTLVQLDSTSEQYVQIAQQVAQREQKLAQVMSASKNVITPYQRSLNALTATYSNQRQELRALRTALENLDPATAEYRSAFERAAEITHDLQERQELLRRSSSDLGVQLGNMRDIGTGLAAGWSSINALMVLTGNKSEDLQKVMVKLQAGIALVQGLKGLEGLKNSIKGYIKGASKWFDNIAGLTKGQKTLQNATEGVTDAVNQSKSAELSGAGAANTLAAGEKAATTATITLTSALKALAVSLGIGALIAAVSAGLNGLIRLITKTSNLAKENYNNAGVAADDWANRQEEAKTKIIESHNEIIESLKKNGATQEEIERENSRYILEMRHHYQDLDGTVRDYTDTVVKHANTVKDLNPEFIVDNNKPITSARFGFNEEDFQTIRKMERAIQDLGAVSETTWDNWERGVRASYLRIKNNGIQTYQDLIDAEQIYLNLSADNYQQWADDVKNANEKAAQEEKNELIRTAQEGVKTRLQILQEEKKKALEKFKEGETGREDVEKYYNKLIADERKKAAKNTVNTEKEKAENILKRAKEASQTELENLDAKYKEEKRLLIKYHKDTAALDEEYEKKRRKIILNNNLKGLDLEYKQNTQGKGWVKDMASVLGYPSSGFVQEYNDFMYDAEKDLLEKKKKLWEEERDKLKEGSDDRKAAEIEIAEITIKLQDLATSKIINDAKTRKQAVQEEIDELNRALDNMEAKTNFDLHGSQTAYTMSHTNNASGAGSGILEAFWGGKNASYKQMQEQMDTENAIITAGLEARLAALKKFKAENELTKDQMLAYDQQIASLETELNNQIAENQIQTAELTQEKWETFLDAGVSVMQSFSDILGSIADTMEAHLQHQLEIGEMTEDQAEEQRKKIKAIQIAQAVVSTISGAIGAFTQASATIPPPAGQIVGGVAMAAVLAAGAASIAQMKATDKNTNSISNSLPIASPSMTGFEKDYEKNYTNNSEVSALRNALEGAEIRAWVLESDITNAQTHSRRRSAESTF